MKCDRQTDGQGKNNTFPPKRDINTFSNKCFANYNKLKEFSMLKKGYNYENNKRCL